MSETKFTPGPWTWSDEYPSRDGSKTFSLMAHSDRYGVLSCDGRGNSPQGNNSADAHLIAAAPELYEALELILPLAKGYRPDGQTDTAKKTCREWIAAAEAALSRARGETE